MAKANRVPQGSWILAEELLENGDPRFLDELCTIHDADRLGAFAVTWFNDRRAASRQLLLSYLDRPLKTYRHEPLVKRLFKAAEAAGDDELMASFMVVFDRSVRRVKQTRSRYDWQTRESWTEAFVRVPDGTAVPRRQNAQRIDRETGAVILAPNLEKHRRLQLFSVATRCYLRRRVWRYFRNLGRQDPARYAAAVSQALLRYTDDDCADGLALIDNWSLMHVLFHGTEVLQAKARGWYLVEGRSLSDLQPSPAFPAVWQSAAETLLDFLDQAQSRPVRQWALAILKQYHPASLSCVPVTRLLKWISGSDESVAELAVELLFSSAAAADISTEAWMTLLDCANDHVLDRVCRLIEKNLDASVLTLAEKVRVASAKQVPMARLGLSWLKSVSPSSAEECRLLLQLREAQAESLRGEIMAWLCAVLEKSPHFDAADLLLLLDARHANVREVAWQWLLRDERLSGRVLIWQRLMESPYDDIQLRLASLLEAEASRSHQSSLLQIRDLDGDHVRHLWASVLLNIHRGGRQKPGVVSGIVERLQGHPSEAQDLLPLLGIAVRSVRTAEWRTALAGLVRLVDSRPELRSEILQTFPELTIA